MIRILAATLSLLAACGPSDSRAGTQVRAGVIHSGDHVIVRVIPEFGTRINALQPPRLEFPSGRSVPLGSDRVSGDSAYFTAPPEVTLPATTPLAGALIRVSVCDSGGEVCNVVLVPL